MQFVPNGPDMPDRLIQAHEEGRVVFFCGAGVSCPAGLPTFRQLVEKSFEAVGEPPDHHEQQLLEHGELDRALGHYESRLQGGRWAARRHLPELLKPDLSRPGALRTHQALLVLARRRNGQTRLVTTNFDTLFEEAAKRTRPPGVTIHPSPPERPDWEGLVYLHGRLASDPTARELEALVLSEADFGTAYLIQGWAARFVAGLFRDFMVCFVGYAVNDPVLRYMVAAQALTGNQEKLFAFVRKTTADQRSSQEEWLNERLIPIHYDAAGGHRTLHRTLQVWASLYPDGVRGKARIVKRYASKLSKQSSTKNDFVRRWVRWALSDPSGQPARQFAELEPAPSLEWLEVLKEECFGHEDLARFQVPPLVEARESPLLHRGGEVVKDIKFSLLKRPAPYPLAPRMALAGVGDSMVRLDEIMWQLGCWLLNYLDEPRLILWLAEQGGQLHPEFAKLVDVRLEEITKWERANNTVELDRLRRRSAQAIPRPAMRTLWRLLLYGWVGTPRSDHALRDWFQQLTQHGLTPALRLSLRKLLAPCVVLQAPNEYDEWKFRVVAALEHPGYTLQSWQISETWKAALPRLLEDASGLLKDHLDLLAELGMNAKEQGWLRSLGEWQFNNEISDWRFFAILTRDAWLATANQDRTRARRMAEGWWASDHAQFRRLALFAAAQDQVIPGQTALDWLTAEHGRWLWEKETESEVLNLLKVLPKRLSEEQTSRLERLILEGPPPDVPGHDPQTTRRMQLIRLQKLQEGGASLSARACQLLPKSPAAPSLQPSSVQRDRNDPFTRVPRQRQVLMNWLCEHPDLHKFSQNDWESFCREKFSTPAGTLIALAKQGKWLPNRWARALEVWAKERHRQRSWRCLAPWLVRAPDAELQAMAGSVSSWLNAMARDLDQHENLFFELCERLLRLKYPADGSTGDLQSHAINHPVGRVTWALLDWWDGRQPKLQAGQGVHQKLKPILTPLCDSRNAGYRPARVVLAMRAMPLFMVDPEWAREHLLPQFDWNRDPDSVEALGAWMGFLVEPDLRPDFLEAIRPSFLETARHFDQLDRYKQQYAGLLTVVALEGVDASQDAAIFSREELRKAFRNLPAEGFAWAAVCLTQSLEKSGDQREVHWDQRVKPLLEEIWPKTRDKFTAQVSEELARLFTATGPRLPEAMRDFGHWLVPVERPDVVAMRIQEKNLGSQHPEASLDLLDKVTGERQPVWSEDFRQCLDAIARARPNLAGDPRLTRLWECYRRYT